MSWPAVSHSVTRTGDSLTVTSTGLVIGWMGWEIRGARLVSSRAEQIQWVMCTDACARHLIPHNYDLMFTSGYAHQRIAIDIGVMVSMHCAYNPGLRAQFAHDVADIRMNDFAS